MDPHLGWESSAGRETHGGSIGNPVRSLPIYNAAANVVRDVIHVSRIYLSLVGFYEDRFRL